jgi:hypothetical protein
MANATASKQRFCAADVADFTLLEPIPAFMAGNHANGDDLL